MNLFPLLVPAGNNKEVQFNDNGLFGGDSTFTFDKATNILKILGTVGIGIDPTRTLDLGSAGQAHMGIEAAAGFDAQITFVQTGTGAVGKIGYDDSDSVFKITHRTFGDNNIVITSTGVGYKEIAPETLAEWTHTAPYLTLHNETHEDADGGRESRLIFKGEQSGGEETVGFQFEASHDGAADDQKFKGVWSVNTGAGLVEAMRLDSNKVLAILGIGDGGLTNYDLKVGTTGTPTYGMIQMGNSVIGRTSYKAGSIDLDGAILVRNIGGPVTSEIEFIWTESTGDTCRFALPKSAVGNATYNSRSMLLAGPAPADTDFVKVSYWQTNNSIFNNLACDTAGDGADLGVQNDLEVEGDIFGSGGTLYLKEITTPSAVADYGAIYTKSDNELYYQDGAGREHILHGDAFSSLWFHNTAATVTIATQNLFTKVTIFVNEGPEDDNGNVVGDASNDNLTINAAGTYALAVQASMTNDGGGAAEFHLGFEVILNSAKTITDATNATPIVITSTAHDLKSGDGVTQSGVGGNTAANGDFSITRLSADTYSLQDLAHADVAGNGAYTSGGSVTSVIPGQVYIEAVVSNISLERAAAMGSYELEAGDVLECVAVNQDGTANLAIEQINFSARRLGD